MAALIYLDTHVVAWLYARGAEAPLSDAARQALRGAEDLRLSPMARLELQYLFEVGRTTVPAAGILDELSAAVGLRLCDAPFPAVARAAEGYAWTRDPFDRLIVAQAALRDAPLVTKDRTIHEHYPGALW